MEAGGGGKVKIREGVRRNTPGMGATGDAHMQGGEILR